MSGDGEFFALVDRAQRLTDELNDVRRQIAEHNAAAGFPQPDYRIALRPDIEGEDPFSHETLMDDIVVRNVSMFRAEQMDTDEWWVCCYLDELTGDRICWQVSARARPRRIEWVTTEFPQPHHVYEHELKAGS